MTDDELNLAIRARKLKDLTPSKTIVKEGEGVQNDVRDEFISLLLCSFEERTGSSIYAYRLSPYAVQKISAALDVYDQVYSLTDE